ncbi:MAG: hypothetical protein P8Y45_10705 [Exilibacterium sp.]
MGVKCCLTFLVDTYLLGKVLAIHSKKVTTLQAHVDKSPKVGGWEINGGTSWHVKTKGKYAMAGRTFEYDMRSDICVIGKKSSFTGAKKVFFGSEA